PALLCPSSYCYAPPPHLHSFPTRRSSDLDMALEPGCAQDALDRERRGVRRRELGSAHALPRGRAHPARQQRDRARNSRAGRRTRSEEHTSELQSRENLVCRLLLEKKKKTE